MSLLLEEHPNWNRVSASLVRTIPFQRFLSKYLLIDPMKGYDKETPTNDKKVEKQSKVFSHDVPEDLKNPLPDDKA